MTFFETCSIIGTLVGCTWYIAQKLNTFVTHEVCSRRRGECPCRRDLGIIKQFLKTTDLQNLTDTGDLSKEK